MVVKIMVPFWVPEVLGAVLYSGPKKTINLTTTQVSLLAAPGLWDMGRESCPERSSQRRSSLGQQDALLRELRPSYGDP